MSGIVAPTHTLLDNIPLGRRIKEIMEDKGKHYSISAMAVRIGVNRETLRLMLTGQREIYGYELKWIAKDLKLTVDQVLQEDSKTEGEWLTDLLTHKEEQEKTLILANELLNKSLGLSERCHALYRLAQAHFFNHNFDEAYSMITKAHDIAIRLKQEFQDETTLYHVLSYMVTVYTAKQDYSNAAKALESVESSFKSDPNKVAVLCYLHAKIKESLGDIESSKSLAYQSYEQAKITNKKNLIGKTAINAAHFEYLSMNYAQSKSLLEDAIPALSDDVYTQLIARKELIKSLIMLGQINSAEHEIAQALEDVKGHAKFHKIEGKLLILKARATNDPEFAENVAVHEEYGKDVRLLACKFLKNYFGNKGDSIRYSSYYEIEEQLDPNRSDILSEGAL